MRRTFGATACAWALVATTARATDAQTADSGRTPATASHASAFAGTTPAGLPPTAIEWLGGSIGSVAGLGAAWLLVSAEGCGEDLRCILGNAAMALAVGTAGSAAGAYGAGRLSDTEPSGWGAIAGALVGAAAAVGVDHLLTEEASVDLSQGARFIAFGVTQGGLTALGSRLGALAR